MAFHSSRFQPADAAPYNGFAAAIVPMDSPELFTALAADNHLGKAMVAAICVLLPVRAGLYGASPNQFLLHPHENVSRNDGLMVVLYIILRDNAVVLHPGLVQKIGGIGFLQESVADVFLIAENLVDGAGVPFGFASACQNAVPLQTGSDLVHTVSFQILPVNAFDHFGLGGINDQMAFRVLRIAEKPIVNDLHLSVLVAELQTQLHILAQRLTFLLGQRCHDRNQNFSLGVHSVDGFLLEIDRNVLFFELADVFQAVQCIAGKPADGLGNNHVDVPSHAFVNHAVEFGALFGVGTGDTVISEYSGEFPFWIFMNVLGVMLHLGFIACRLLIAVSTDTTVRLLCINEIKKPTCQVGKIQKNSRTP